jgi:hypothetical protein
MCKQKLSWFSFLLVPFIIGFANAFFGLGLEERVLVGVAFAVCLGGYVHFAFSIINILTKHLNIKCLSIPPPKSKD